MYVLRADVLQWLAENSAAQAPLPTTFGKLEFSLTLSPMALRRNRCAHCLE